MRCEDCREHLSAFLDRELDLFHRQEVEAHLEHCPRCREDLAALEQTALALQDAPTALESLLPTAAVLSRLPALRAQRERAVRRAEAGAAAAGLLGLVALLWLAHALSDVNVVFRLVIRLGALLYTPLRGATGLAIGAPLVGWGLLALTLLGFILSGLLVLGARPLEDSR